MVRRITIALLLLCLACTPLEGGSRPASLPPIGTAVQPTVPAVRQLTILYQPSMAFAVLYVAADRGFFRERTIAPDPRRVESADAALSALSSGQADLALVDLSASAFATLAKGNDSRIVASPGVWGKVSPSVLIARPGGPVTSTADLRGKRVGVAGGAGSPAQYALSVALRSASLTIDDVQTVNLDGTATETFDAALVPTSTNAAITPSVLVRDFAPGLATSFVLASSKLIRDPELLADALGALVAASRAIQGSGYLAPDSLAAYSRYTGLPADAIRGAPPLVYDLNLAIAAASLVDQERFYREFKLSGYSNPFSVEGAIDDRALRDAVARAGPIRTP